METERGALDAFDQILIAWVGPFETWAWCHATICSRHLPIVRPRRHTSKGHRFVGEVAGDLSNPRDRERGVGVVIGLAATSFAFHTNHTLRFGSPAASNPIKRSRPSTVRRSWAINSRRSSTPGGHPPSPLIVVDRGVTCEP